MTVCQYDLTDTAMCIWEAILEASGTDKLPEGLGAYWETWGTCAVRDQVQKLAPFCHLEWQATIDSPTSPDLGSFDWDWCPAWLADRVSWDAEHGASVKEA